MSLHFMDWVVEEVADAEPGIGEAAAARQAEAAAANVARRATRRAGRAFSPSPACPIPMKRSRRDLRPTSSRPPSVGPWRVDQQCAPSPGAPQQNGSFTFTRPDSRRLWPGHHSVERQRGGCRRAKPGRLDVVHVPSDGRILGGRATPTSTALSGYPTYDAAVLEFDFMPTANQVVFNYAFASDEYPEWVNTPFNDVFAFYVNGTNYATVRQVAGDPTSPFVPVAVNNINNGNPDFYPDFVPAAARPVPAELLQSQRSLGDRPGTGRDHHRPDVPGPGDPGRRQSHEAGHCRCIGRHLRLGRVHSGRFARQQREPRGRPEPVAGIRPGSR